mgnify:CR=1 FL=1
MCNERVPKLELVKVLSNEEIVFSNFEKKGRKITKPSAEQKNKIRPQSSAAADKAILCDSFGKYAPFS